MEDEQYLDTNRDEQIEEIKSSPLHRDQTKSEDEIGSLNAQETIDVQDLLRNEERNATVDIKEYNNFINRKVEIEKVKRIFNEFYLLSNNFAECALIYLFNSYDETGMSRLFQAFYLEFDANGDMKMQIEEMEQCIEYLGRDEFIGKEKMIDILKELEIDCKNSLSFFQEGGAAKKILN